MITFLTGLFHFSAGWLMAGSIWQTIDHGMSPSIVALWIMYAFLYGMKLSNFLWERRQ